MLKAISIDVRVLLATVDAGGGPHLVTRPIGSAVRRLIQQAVQGSGEGTLAVVDLRKVVVLDFSGADEVVAGLLAEEGDCFLVFRCLAESHLDQMRSVITHRSLTAVAETGDGHFELLGRVNDPSLEAWTLLEEIGSVAKGDIHDCFPSIRSRQGLAALAEARLAFRCPDMGSFHSLSHFVPRRGKLPLGSSSPTADARP